MRNRKITLIVSFLLVLTMLFGSFSAAATDDVTTTGPAGTTDEVVSTTAASDEEKSDDYWDGYDDGYNDGYDDGYYDGEYDAWEDGYYEGYYDGINDSREPSVFEKMESFIEEFIYRIEDFFYRIQDFFDKLFKKGDYTEPTKPDNSDFIPDGSQETLAGDVATAALCVEFNDLINDFMDIKEPVTITKNVDVGVEAKELPSVVQSVANEIIEQFAGQRSVTNDYEEGDYAGTVQSTYLVPEGLCEASKTVNSDGTTDYKFVLIAEAAYYDGTETYGVKLVDGEIVETYLQHEDAADAIYIEDADLGPVTITEAEIYYPGATITAKTDAEGRLIAYDINMPVEGTGIAKVATITVVASLEGYRNEGFVMTYAD